jgi:hypothetical protein
MRTSSPTDGYEIDEYRRHERFPDLGHTRWQT